MTKINIPLAGSRAQIICSRHVTRDFLSERAKINPEGRKIIEYLVESFDGHPESRRDILFPSTPVGTAHVRYRSGYYIFFQRFNAAQPLRYKIKLWWCGTYTVKSGRLKFDFEKLDE
ncbi:hypothetical protein [Azospirillum brasilense]|uniref:hypothetical protein n=1 Tax=Azospirillum brasilense TaxID=192 RepID=UPI0011EE3F5C|nr:hypothetical protein [Azospirillum brasilense]